MKKIRLMLTAAVATVFLTAASCSSNNKAADAAEEQPTEAVEPAVESAGVIDLTNDDQFRPDTKVSKLTVLDFNAVWCVPCKLLAPSFHEAADNLGANVDFYSVDIDANPKTADAFGVREVPTVIFIAPDGTMKKFVGLDGFGTAEELDKAQTAEQLGNVIYPNLVKIIESLQK